MFNEEAFYLVGFVDGEGSFNISFKIRQDYLHKVQIYPSFNISQKEKNILIWIQSFLECGAIRNRGDGVYYYEVHSLKDLREKIIPFFKNYKLKTKKRKAFKIFSIVIKILTLKKSLDWKDIQYIYLLREKVKVGRQRKYSLDDLQKLWVSSETIRQIH